MPLLVLGVIMGVAVLGLVHQFSLFGNTCFFIGEMNPNATCIAPVIYYGVLGVAALFIVLGAVQLLKPNSPPTPPSN